MFAKLIDNEIILLSPTDYDIVTGEKWIPIKQEFIDANEDNLEGLIGLFYRDPETNEVGLPEIFPEV